MCGTDRPSQDGAVAVIHRAVSSQNIRLLFRNPTHSSIANTIVSYETGVGYELGARQGSQEAMQELMLQIQYVILNPCCKRKLADQITGCLSVSMVTSPPQTKTELPRESL